MAAPDPTIPSAPDAEQMKSHIIERTSPKGSPFVGTCSLCGTEGLTLANMHENCPGNQMSADDTLIAAIDPEPGDGIEFVDRYSALGMARPDPATVCDGQCEGTGYVPIASDETDPVFKALWDEAESKELTDDGWHFVRCPDCNGTGKHS